MNLRFLVGKLVIVLLAVLPLCPGLAQEVLSLNTTSAPPLANDDQTGFHDLLAIEAFKRLGRKITIEHLPGERSLINLDKGIDDATVVRIEGLERLYPNIRRVPEPMMRWEFVAFARNVDLTTTDWSALKPYNVAFINGWKILEANVGETRSVTKVRDSEQLFNLLRNDRTDLVLYEKWEGFHMIDALGLDDVTMLEPPLAAPEMYMYVHEKHEKLIPELATALKAMKEDGTYQQIFDRTLKAFDSD